MNEEPKRLRRSEAFRSSMLLVLLLRRLTGAESSTGDEEGSGELREVPAE